MLASEFQVFKVHGYFDETLNPPGVLADTPEIPNSWPTVDRSASDPEHWFISQAHPMNRSHVRQGMQNGIHRIPGEAIRRHAAWQLMINSHDQLRQKTGFAL